MGFVTGQTPAGGSSAQGEVVITVGGHRGDVFVPDVVGLTLAQRAGRRSPPRDSAPPSKAPRPTTPRCSREVRRAGARSLLVGSLVTLTTE